MRTLAMLCLVMAFGVGFVGCSAGPGELDMEEVMKNKEKTLAGDSGTDTKPAIKTQ